MKWKAGSPGPTKGKAGSPRRRLWLPLGVLAGGMIAAAVVALRPAKEAGITRDEPPAPLLVEAIPWPSVPREAASGLAAAKNDLQRALAHYSQGDRDGGDSLVAESIGGLERVRALVAEAGGYHLQTVISSSVKGDFPEAEQRARRWLEKFPDDFDHLFLLGQARYQMKRWAAAAESFRAAAARRPRSVDTLRWLAQTCSQMGAQDEAVDSIRRSFELMGFPGKDFWSNPLAPQVLRNAVAVLHRFHEFDLLEKAAAEYVRKFPGNTEASMALGVALTNIGRVSEAEPYLRTARADPSNAANFEEIDFSLGLGLLKHGRIEEAVFTLASLLAADPFYSKAYYQLGMALSRLGRLQDADAMIARSRELAPSERELRRETELRGAGFPGRAAAAGSLGHALRGELDEAERALRASELRSDLHAVFALADLYLDSLRVQDAEKVLAHAAAIAGDGHPEVAGRRALAFHLRGEKTRALDLLRALARARETPALWRMHLARLLLPEGGAAEAAAILAPLRQSGADREASYLLGRAHAALGKGTEALEMLRSISTADTRWDDWEGDVWLARALVASGEAGLAEAERLLDSVPVPARSTEAYMRARVDLLEKLPGRAPDLTRAREALTLHESVEASASPLAVRAAQTPWTDASPIHLALARLYHARGESRRAMRHARLALVADPKSLEALRTLAEWLNDPADAFLRLRILRDIGQLAPQDAANLTAIRAIESRWLTRPPTMKPAK